MRLALEVGVIILVIVLSACNDNDTNTGRLERVTDRLEDVADRLGLDGGRLLLDASTPQDVFLLNVDDASTEQTDTEVLTVDGDVPNAILAVEFFTPDDGAVFSQGDPIEFSAQILSDVGDPSFIAVSAFLNDSERLPVTYDPESLTVFGEVLAPAPGAHTITIAAKIHPSIEVRAQRSFEVDCIYRENFSSALDLDMWTILGDAHRSDEGWLEATSGRPSSRGAILLTGISLSPAELDISFRVQAQPNGNLSVPQAETMSDGFAVTFWNVSSDGIDDLDRVTSRSGNGMGYGVYPIQLEETGLARPRGFTVEFDTYHNYCRREAGGWYQDPTDEAHVAITYDGYWYFPHHYENEDGEWVEIPTGKTIVDASGQPTSIACDLIQNQGYDLTNQPEHPWAAVPTLRDEAWHDVRVLINGGIVRVEFDGNEVLTNQAVFGKYQGGFLSFSGGSGAAAARFRLDDLEISGLCPSNE